MRTAKAFLLGVGAAYLFDPVAGKQRRRLIVDRVARAGRTAVRWSVKKARFGRGKLRGVLAAITRPLGTRPTMSDDSTVVQRIRSEAFREAGVSTKDVDVDVQNGVATLRGAVESTSVADELIERVRKVQGVVGVAPMIRVSGPAS
jgi:osmotically-inducible protein OsmY